MKYKSKWDLMRGVRSPFTGEVGAGGGKGGPPSSFKNPFENVYRDPKAPAYDFHPPPVGAGQPIPLPKGSPQATFTDRVIRNRAEKNFPEGPMGPRTPQDKYDMALAKQQGRQVASDPRGRGVEFHKDPGGYMSNWSKYIDNIPRSDPQRQTESKMWNYTMNRLGLQGEAPKVQRDTGSMWNKYFPEK